MLLLVAVFACMHAVCGVLLYNYCVYYSEELSFYCIAGRVGAYRKFTSQVRSKSRFAKVRAVHMHIIVRFVDQSLNCKHAHLKF